MKDTDKGRVLAVLTTADEHAAELVAVLAELRAAIDADMVDDADAIVDALVRVRAKARKAAEQARAVLS
jgi:hypothetical protein